MRERLGVSLLVAGIIIKRYWGWAAFGLPYLYILCHPIPHW